MATIAEQLYAPHKSRARRLSSTECVLALRKTLRVRFLLVEGVGAFVLNACVHVAKLVVTKYFWYVRDRGRARDFAVGRYGRRTGSGTSSKFKR